MDDKIKNREVKAMEKIKYETLNDLNGYQNLEIDTSDYVVCHQPLFHGTTRKAIDCDPKEMEKIHDQALLILKTVKSYYLENESKPGFLDLIEKYHKKSGNHIFCDELTLTIGEIHVYEYGNLYVTTNFLSALNYSLMGFGELAKRAYYNAIALKELNIDLGISDAVNFIVEEYNQFKDSERVVLMLENVLFEDLSDEAGNPLIFKDKNGLNNHFYCKQAYNSKVTERSVRSHNYRVKNLNKYTFKLINKCLFRIGIKCFTKIKEVDKFLSERSSHNYRITNAEMYDL